MKNNNNSEPTFNRNDAFEEVSAIFTASGVQITENMLNLMSPLLSGSQSFVEHRKNLQKQLEVA